MNAIGAYVVITVSTASSPPPTDASPPDRLW